MMDKATKLELLYSFSFASFPTTREDLLSFIDILGEPLGLNTHLMHEALDTKDGDYFESLDELCGVETESDFNFPNS